MYQKHAKYGPETLPKTPQKNYSPRPFSLLSGNRFARRLKAFPRRPQDGPTCSGTPLKRPQDVPLEAPRRPFVGAKTAQAGPRQPPRGTKRSPRDPRRAPRRPKTPQDVPQEVPIRPKRSQDCFKRHQEAPKTAPRRRTRLTCSQDALETPTAGPKTARDGPVEVT